MTAAFLAALAAATGVRLWLLQRQARSVAAHRAEVPEAFAGDVPLEAHRKAADYTIAKIQFARVAVFWRAALLLLFTLGGGLERLDRLLPGETLWSGTAYLLAAAVLLELCLLPLAVYATFSIEARFGFNRTTPGLFLADLLKQLVLGLAIGGPVAFGALLLIRRGGELWWVAAWSLWLAFSLLLTWAYPAFIAPLFNKFVPLRDERLKERIERLVERTGFLAEGIFVMDGSRRSTHANAYFTGLGRKKRIVFFDTLCDMLEPPEIEAVLAHELGHFKLHHLRTRLLYAAATGLLGLALFHAVVLNGFAWFESPAWFFEGLGVSRPSAHAGLILFAWVVPLFLFPLRPLLSGWSRRHEFAADAFAVAHSERGALESALVKMYEKNASTLTPDRLYSAFFDSHPPAPLRIGRLKNA